MASHFRLTLYRALRRLRLVLASVLFATLLLPVLGKGGSYALEAGQTVSGSVEVAGVTFPLPEGEWTAYYAAEGAEDKFPTTKLGLALISGNAVKQTAYFRVTRSKIRAGFKAYALCSQPHYFYGETVVNRVGGDQDCWHVQSETLAPDDQSDRQKAVIEFAKSRKLFLPLVVIGPRYHKADQEVLFQASYGWTPDLIIKAPKDIKAWRFQDWTAEAAATDPRKKVILSKFKRWGEEWRPKIDGAFAASKSK